MTEISEFIVYLWLLPVTLFVVLPLISLFIWGLTRIVCSAFDLLRFGRVETWSAEALRS